MYKGSQVYEQTHIIQKLFHSSLYYFFLTQNYFCPRTVTFHDIILQVAQIIIAPSQTPVNNEKKNHLRARAVIKTTMNNSNLFVAN